MAKARARIIKVELPPISLKSVNSVVPRDEKEKGQLLEDLIRMGCRGFLAKPWALKNEVMAQEFLQPRSNQWEGTLRRDPDWQTVDLWAEVYSFRKKGCKLAARTDKQIDSKFKSPINSKDGHAVDDCIDPRERRILEFVVPILYLEKQNQVTKEVGNTIFGALAGEYKVNQGQVIQIVIGRLVSNLEKRKFAPISLYLFHLYNKNECLQEEEIEELEVARKYLELGITPDAA